MSAQPETNHAREQAQAQLESIVEMVAALDRKEAADLYANKLTREQCVALIDADELPELIATEPDDDELRTLIAERITDETIDPDDFEFDEEAARETIQEDALSVEVRSDWHTPGSEDNEPTEYTILLCTGGPAVRIIGDLDSGQPDSARLEYQDWGTPWTELITMDSAHEAILTYARQFYFGE